MKDLAGTTGFRRLHFRRRNVAANYLFLTPRVSPISSNGILDSESFSCGVKNG
jgi:hypothetical protein